MKNENEVKHTPTEFTCSTTEDLSGICEKCGNGLDMHDGDYKCLVQQKHTPTPWRHGDSPGDVCEIVGIETGKPYSSIIAETCGYKGQREANAAFIVRAVNSHEKLLASVKEYLHDLERGELPTGEYWRERVELIKEAITEAEGK